MSTKKGTGHGASSSNRSAKTGRYVTAGYAKRHPATTVTEKRK